MRGPSTSTSDVEDEVIRPGRLLAGRYRIEELIGRGAYARVYRASQVDLGRDVALKVLDLEESELDRLDQNGRKRFEREARLVSQLQNPHTVTLYDYGQLEGGEFFMVLEYVDGRTLREAVDEGSMSAGRIVRIWRQILDSLREAHAANVVHRDLKPTNVMLYDRVGESDCVKVLDFGVAKSVASERRDDESLTAKGAVIGTPKYMSPEQLLGQPLRPASDLFSVGLLGYLMYAGELPYEVGRPASILDRMRAFERDLGELESAPEPVRSVAQRLLAPEPEDRYQSAGAVLRDLSDRDDEEEEVRGGARGANASSSAFPMGLDSGGGPPTDKLTGAVPREAIRPSSSEASGGAESQSNGAARTSELPPSEARTVPLRRGESRDWGGEESAPLETDEEVSEETTAPFDGDGETWSRASVLAVVVGLLGVGAMIGGLVATERGSGPATKEREAVMPPERAADSDRVPDVRARARETVGEGIHEGMLAATKEARSAASDPEPPETSDPPRQRKARSRGSERASGEPARETNRDEGGEADAPEDFSVTPLDQSDDEASGSESSEASDDFEVEAWK